MANQLKRSAVRIYGALSALGGGSGDVLESLLPFLEPILREHNGEKLDPNIIASKVQGYYKWNCNSDIIETFVPYMEGQGWIIADTKGTQPKTYTIQMPPDSDLDEPAKTAEAELRRISEQFMEFWKGLSPITFIPNEVEIYEEVLLKWLLYVEAFDEKDMESSTEIAQSTDASDPISLSDEEKFLCARFVKHAIEEDKSNADTLAKISAIGLLTEVVQDFIKPTDSIRSTRLSIYLDAPVAMDLLGVSGKLAQENTKPLIDELHRIGASIRILEQSVEEIQRVLKAAITNPLPTSPTTRALTRGELIRDYLNEAYQNPVQLLENFHVEHVRYRMQLDSSKDQYFTENNWRNLYNALNYAGKEKARKHDADIASFVIKERKGHTNRDIFESRAIVLTRNNLFSQIVYQTYGELNLSPKHATRPVVHRRFLATAVWLRTGMRAANFEIPKRLLLSNCEKVLTLHPRVVDKVIELTEALEDEQKSEQLQLLLFKDRSMQALMDKTLGNADVITQENFSQLWEDMLYPHIEGERKKGDDALKMERKKNKKRLKKYQEKHLEEKEHLVLESSSLEEQLRTKNQEDIEAVKALCENVNNKIDLCISTRKRVAIILALTLGIQILIEAIPMPIRVVLFVIGTISSYFTYTGGRLLTTEMSEEDARKVLGKTAEERGLLSKISSFDISWDKTAFSISEKYQVGTDKNHSDNLI